MRRIAVDPYLEHEMPALAARGIAHAYVATALFMPMLFVLEVVARRSGFADDGLDAAALRCLGPSAIGASCALADKRFRLASRAPFVQGSVLMTAMGVLLALSAAATGGTESPYVISLQTMLYLWSLIMPGGARRAAFPVPATLVAFFATLSLVGAFDFDEVRAKVVLLLSGTSAALSVAYAEVLERWRRAVSAASSLDALTQLYNRRYLLERFAVLHAECIASARPLSVITFDIDHFKSVNDRFGHAVGDRVIKHVAETLAAAIRATDLAGRLGGEEFVLVLDGCEGHTAASIAERVRAGVASNAVSVGDERVAVSVSAGISTMVPGIRATLDDLLRVSDEALYRSKRGGRDRVTVADRVASDEFEPAAASTVHS